MPQATTIEPSVIKTIVSQLEQLNHKMQKIETIMRESDQSWYWSKKWQAMEREADEAEANGDFVEFDNVEDLIADLHA